MERWERNGVDRKGEITRYRDGVERKRKKMEKGEIEKGWTEITGLGREEKEGREILEGTGRDMKVDDRGGREGRGKVQEGR